MSANVMSCVNFSNLRSWWQVLGRQGTTTQHQTTMEEVHEFKHICAFEFFVLVQFETSTSLALQVPIDICFGVSNMIKKPRMPRTCFLRFCTQPYLTHFAMKALIFSSNFWQCYSLIFMKEFQIHEIECGYKKVPLYI